MKTFFEIISQPISSHYSDDWSEQESIAWHLSHLLNTRQGSLPHLPDYGLPDLNEIYRGFPRSIPSLLYAITQAIIQYEPRLHKTHLVQKPSSRLEAILCIEIQAMMKIDQRSLALTTYFHPAGKINFKS